MAVKRIFNERRQFFDANGDPLNGGQLFVYDAGSSTKTTTYNSSAGSVANTNPLVLDSAGRLQAEVWVTSGSTYKLVLTNSTDTDPPTSPIWTEDNIAAIGDALTTFDQWLAGPTPTYVSSSSFTLVGDQTSTFMVGRRVKITDSGGTKYGTIKTSAFTTLTTITLDADSDSLATPTSAVSYGLISPTNTSAPLFPDTLAIRSGSADETKKYRLELDGFATATTVVGTPAPYAHRIGNLPAGVIMDFAGSTVPTGWLECDGSAVSRTTYADLFSAISTTWGAGDGSTTFNLPDLRGRSRIGKGTGTVAESVTDANVSVANDTFTVASNNTKWITGMAVVLTTTTTLPTGLSLATTYYVIRDSATTIKFASTLANAQNGTAIDITAVVGSGTHTVTGTLTARTLGEIGGEESHAMSLTELLAHTHSTTTLGSTGTGAGLTTPGTNQTDGSENPNTGSRGGNAAMNIMQPYGAVMTIISY